jgi:gliding motility associated protien GldN
LIVLLIGSAEHSFSQKSRKSTRRTTNAKSGTATQDTPDPNALLGATKPPAADSPVVKNDSLPLKPIRKSLRLDEAVETSSLHERIPLQYEHLRADDAAYREKLIREIDCREKINLPFMYSVDTDDGNQRFISILLQTIQDGDVTAFSDDRFTTPMTKSEVSKMVAGEEIEVTKYDTLGQIIGTEKKRNDINLDSFYRFHVKEEVIFDKESSRLFWRILGIAPVKNFVTASGVDLGPSELFWVYYPDMRPILAKYEVYNPKNFSARLSWEELFENRFFSSRIIKTTIDNPKDLTIDKYPGIKDNTLRQLYQGQSTNDKIFTYEQDLWSY